VLTLLEVNSLTVNQARDVLSEAEHQLNANVYQVMDATAFRLVVATPLSVAG
jgi:hypothetical protein